MATTKWLYALGRAAGMAALCVVAIVGCGGTSKSGPATVEVTGKVTLEGSPVEGASVLFSPSLGSDDGRLASQARTDKGGRFRLSTHIGIDKVKSGIVPGQYVVTVTKTDTAAVKDTLSPPKNMLPRKYADPKASELKADVLVGKANDFPFALKKD